MAILVDLKSNGGSSHHYHIMQTYGLIVLTMDAMDYSVACIVRIINSIPFICRSLACYGRKGTNSGNV